MKKLGGLLLVLFSALQHAFAACPASPSVGYVSLNEIDSEEEFIEVYVNRNNVDMSGWQLKVVDNGDLKTTYTCVGGASACNKTYNTGDIVVFSKQAGNSASITTAINDGHLTVDQNLFYDPDEGLDVKDEKMEILLEDSTGGMVSYMQFHLIDKSLYADCATENPNDTIIWNGQYNGNICATPDSSNNFWYCNDTPGEDNDGVAPIELAQCSDVFPGDYTEKTTDILQNIPPMSDFAPISIFPSSTTFIRGEQGYLNNAITDATYTVAAGTGSAVVYVYGSLDLNNINMNIGGDAEDLILVVDGTLSIRNLNRGSAMTINALIYATGDIELNADKDDINIVGAVRTAQGSSTGILESRGGKVNITYDPEAIENADFGDLCDNTPTAQCPLSPLADTVRINEVNKDEDWIELYINNATNLSMANWHIDGNGRGSSTEVDYYCTSADGCANQTFDTGDFVVVASSITGSVLEATQGASPSLVQGQNLFVYDDLAMHNNTQEIILFDYNGEMIHYLRYETGTYSPEFGECAIENPDNSVIIAPPSGGEEGVCTIPDGSNDPNDWDKNCDSTPGDPNKEIGDDVDHYEVVLPVTSSSVCTDQTIVVRACIDADCNLFDASTDATLFKLVDSTRTDLDSNAFTGFKSYTLSQDIPTVVTFGLDNLNPDATVVCEDTLGNVLSPCQIDFTTDIAFAWQANTYQGQSCNTQNTTLKAKYYDESDQQCRDLEGSLDVDFSFAYASPASGTEDLTLTSGASSIALVEGGSQSLNVMFGAAVTDNITMSYADAGLLQVTAAKTGTNPSYDSDVVDVAFYPQALMLEITSGKKATGDIVAGDTFDYEINAYCSVGGVISTELPNYQPTSLTLTHQLQTGTNSAEFIYRSGASLMTVSTTATTQGIATTTTFNSAYFSEYGRFRIQADESDYLGLGIGISGIYADFPLNSAELPTNSGKFIAHDIQVALETEGNFDPFGSMDIGAGTNDFNYLANEFGYGNQNPELRIKAFSSIDDSGDLRQLRNYFQSSDPSVSLTAIATSGNLTSTLTEVGIDFDQASDHATTGEYIYILSDDDVYQFEKNAASAQAPFISDIDIQLAADDYQDQDGVTNATAFDFDTSGMQMIDGRLYVQNASDVAGGSADIRAMMQYFDGTQWQVSTGDTGLTASTIADDAFTASPVRDNSTNPFDVTISDASGTISNVEASWDNQCVDGLFDFVFDHQNSATTGGQIEIFWDTSKFPEYMHYGWNATDLTAPLNTRVAFGKKRGNDRIISWREIN
ncbi:hypothetical protein HR060_03235 [Catenovulum sp. SM1970]|uniref:DUF6701 domain-containing protein n=1 Tax=Marinifaba aquimaris TaxID=2741323 RepID=UPI00157335B3|nr:DUF6701 domain-containing protein [Marinifaba aquimaris]NTS75871.1 hypothetical protein [Marinifaba aquimaris]